ncbi:MAG: nicotinate-nucleotide adenylyltransferase [Armatimonadetes bacterium]|nr:nicotinate-nucleotide adenylyltransferase [Armatimonadota bacterium]
MDLVQKIGIMGGTFDPIHYGHLVAAEEARWQFGLEKVIFIPAGHPPHKVSRKISEARHRLAMTRLAIESNPFFAASAIEIERPGLSYTINTVRDMRNTYPLTDIYFITGADAVLEILSWKHIDELLDQCCFIAAKRPGYRLGRLKTKLPGLRKEQLKRITVIEVPALAISSTDIRQRVQTGRPIKYLLPEAVEKYIREQGLYREN